MTHKPGGGKSKLKYKVKEIGAVVMPNSRNMWRWE